MAAEAAAADRDELEARVAALQERLEETQAFRGQLANYKQVGLCCRQIACQIDFVLDPTA